MKDKICSRQWPVIHSWEKIIMIIGAILLIPPMLVLVMPAILVILTPFIIFGMLLSSVSIYTYYIGVYIYDAIMNWD